MNKLIHRWLRRAQARLRSPGASATHVDLGAPILPLAEAAFLRLPPHLTAEEALNHLRASPPAGDVGYVYVLTADDRLEGVVPLRALLHAERNAAVRSLMKTNIVTLPANATVYEACEAFARHRLLALPVVDQDRRMRGVASVRLFADEVMDLTERRQTHALFDSIGLRLSKARLRSPWAALPHRFPWLLATITSGLLCAMVTSLFQATLSEALILAFFLTLILGLGESIAAQSMALALQGLHQHVAPPPMRRELLRELSHALVLGAASALIVASAVWVWRGEWRPALVLGLCVVAVILQAAAAGVLVPTLLHRLRLDLRVAAGPITLAWTDVMTLLFYFTLAMWLL